MIHPELRINIGFKGSKKALNRVLDLSGKMYIALSPLCSIGRLGTILAPNQTSL